MFQGIRLYVFLVLCHVINNVAACGVSSVQAITSSREDENYEVSSFQ